MVKRESTHSADGVFAGARAGDRPFFFFFYTNLQSKAAEHQFVSTESPVELEQCLGCGRMAGEGGGLVNPVTN